MRNINVYKVVCVMVSHESDYKDVSISTVNLKVSKKNRHKTSEKNCRTLISRQKTIFNLTIN